MRNFTSFVALTLFTVTASASAMPSLTPLKLGQMREASQSLNLTKAPTRAADNEIITEAPEGKQQVYAVSSLAFYLNADYSTVFGNYSSASEIVYTDDAAYIKNPLGGRATETYLLASKVDEETYVASLPFHLYDEEYYGSMFPYNLAIAEINVNDKGEVSYVPTEEPTVTYKLKDGKFYLDLGFQPEYDADGQITNRPEKILGLFDDYGWVGIGDAYQEWTPVDMEAQTAPEGLVTEDWQLIANDWGREIKVGFADNEVWLTNLSDYMPQAWVKGTVDGDKIIMQSRQYLGLTLGQFIYYVTAEEADVEDGAVILDSFEFSYDAEEKTIKADNPSIYMMLNGSDENIYYLEFWKDPVICVPPADIDLTPKPAMELAWGDYIEYYGFNVLQFAVTNLSVGNYMLDTTNLYYRIVVDDDVVTFYADDSNGALEEDMTDIPFNETFYDYFYVYGTNRQVYIYFTGMDTIGVQMVYKAADGTEYPSEVASLFVGTDSVESVDSSAEVVSHEYFDLNGRKIQAPDKGLYIVKAIDSNGNAIVRKIVR